MSDRPGNRGGYQPPVTYSVALTFGDSPVICGEGIFTKGGVLGNCEGGGSGNEEEG